uniref:Uncharacterized protein n=1 Tax=Plectus sambesii TaxID=2011161 RepID=A0A914X0M0_9BILA
MTTTIPLALTVLCATMGLLLQSTTTTALPLDESSLAHRIQSRAGSGVLLVPYPRVGKRSSALYNFLDPRIMSILDSDQDAEEKRGYLSTELGPDSEISGYLSTLRFGKRSDNEGEEEANENNEPQANYAKRFLMARVGKRFLHAARVG